MIIQKQTWHEFTRCLIYCDHGSVQLELFDEEQPFGGTVYLYALWVEPDYRRKGIARQLLEEALRVAKKEGHKAVYLQWVAIDTPREILDWYLRCGFEGIAFTPGEKVLLRKELSTTTTEN